MSTKFLRTGGFSVLKMDHAVEKFHLGFSDCVV